MLPTASIGGGGGRDSSNRIFIGGIPQALDEGMLRELFGAFGELRVLTLMRTPEGSHKGYGFCEYVDGSKTEQAVAALHGILVHDKPLTVSRAKAPAERGHGSGASGANTVALGGGGGGAFGGGGSVAAMMMQQQQMQHMQAAQHAQQQQQQQMFMLMQMQQAQAQAHLQAQQQAQQHGSGGGGGGGGGGSGGASVPQGVPTRVVCLEGMVSAAELADDGEYRDIVADITEGKCRGTSLPSAAPVRVALNAQPLRSPPPPPPSTHTHTTHPFPAECSKFGALQLQVPRPPLPGHGRVFLHYATLESAVRAATELAGRKFGDSRVRSSYFSEATFAAGRLDA